MGLGAVRTITFNDGAEVVERLESLDDAGRRLSYTILESTLPVEGYVASLTRAGPGSGRLRSGVVQHLRGQRRHRGGGVPAAAGGHTGRV